MTDDFASRIGEYLPHQRWFAGKGRAHAVRDVRTVAWLSGPSDGPADGGDAVRVQIALVDVESSSGVDVYQLPLSHHPGRVDHLEHAYLGEWDGAHVYDALHDRDAVTLLAAGLVGEPVDTSLRTHSVAKRRLDRDGPTALLTGEQSNSNVVVGADLLLKVFRRVAPGRNPDVEILAALTEAASHEIVPLVGWLEGADSSGEPLDLAMLSDFMRTATDGWDLALTSVRDLFAERDLYPDEVGGDFASEAHRLGVTVARLHTELARYLPHASWGPDELRAVTARMHARLDMAVHEVTQLAEHATGLAQAFDALAEIDGEVAVQRVHGDLHLGQALRTIDGWRVIDFEGEPATPLGSRAALDSPVRDVAGMLRSFSYAAQSQWADLLGDHQLAARALEWATRNRESFLAGYAEESGTDHAGNADNAVLLRAYETDKAVYEVVYEARHRPSWLPIPMRAVSQLAAADPVGGRQ